MENEVRETEKGGASGSVVTAEVPEVPVTLPVTPNIFAASADVKAQAEKAKALRELPKPPGTSLTIGEFIAWLRLLTPENSKLPFIYVYRVHPIIVREKVDPEATKNIDIISYETLGDDWYKTLSEKYFIEAHGGGKYKLVVKDTGKKHVSKDNGFFEVNFSIPINVYKPNLDLREVDWDAKDNKGFQAWARAQNLIGADNMPVTATISPASGPDNTVAIMKTVMDFTKAMSGEDQNKFKKAIGGEDSLGKSIGEILLEKMKQDDPNKSITTLATLMQTLQKNQSGNGSGESGVMIAMMPMFLKMMEMSSEASKNQMTMMLEMIKQSRQPNGEGGSSKMSELREMIEVAKELGGGGGGKSSLGEVIVEKLGDIIGPGLNLLNNFMTLKAAEKGIQGMAGTPSPVSPVSPVMPMTQPTASHQPIASLPASTEATPPQPGTPTVSQADVVQMLTQFGPMIFSNLSKEGWEFAEVVEKFFPNGAVLVGTMCNIGETQLVTYMQMVPEFWGNIMKTYGVDHLKKWVHDFVNYKAIIADMEAQEDGEGGEEGAGIEEDKLKAAAGLSGIGMPIIRGGKGN